MTDAAITTTGSQPVNLLKVLGPVHVWGLGVGIVLVGEFMGWNYGVGKGGAFGALVACFISGLLYTCVAMIDSEITSTVAAAGGQYAQAKHTIGPLMAFNVGLFMVLTYSMLGAADVQVAGQLIQIGAQNLGHTIDWQPFTILCLAVLALLNYRGVFATLTVNFVITAIAFLTIIVLLLVETGDLIFALDSIPAIFGVTREPFIVFTSNVFAILGLRSLYFVLAGAIGYFRHLKTGLSVVLVFIGVKMLIDPHDKPPHWFQYDIPDLGALAAVVVIIAISIFASLISARREERHRAKLP